MGVHLHHYQIGITASIGFDDRQRYQVFSAYAHGLFVLLEYGLHGLLDTVKAFYYIAKRDDYIAAVIEIDVQ